MATFTMRVLTAVARWHNATLDITFWSVDCPAAIHMPHASVVKFKSTKCLVSAATNGNFFDYQL